MVVRKATKAIAKGSKKKNKGSTTKALLEPLANGTKKRQDTTTKTTLESGASGTKKPRRGKGRSFSADIVVREVGQKSLICVI